MKETELKKAFILLIISFLIIFSFNLMMKLSQDKYKGSLFLSGFKNDLNTEKKTNSELYSKDLQRKEKFIAYSKYHISGPGDYESEFEFNSGTKEPITSIIEISTMKGREIIFSEKKTLSHFPFKLKIDFTINNPVEIEPRVRYISGNKNVTLKSVKLKRIKKIIPFINIILKTLYTLPLLFLILLTISFINKNDEKWRYSFAMLLFYLAVFQIIRLAWVSEDAFITLRHVENFLAGRGPVFNPGERVEGFTHLLWFSIISILRFLGLSPKGAMILPGLIFSTLFLYHLFFIFNSEKNRTKPSINFAVAVLIGMSCFLDFGTSGLETSLSFFLLILFAKPLFFDKYLQAPGKMGILSALLILNRPDFGIFFIFTILLIIFDIYKKRATGKVLYKYFSITVLITAIYEIFRMGYYGSLFPNPFYAKSGSFAYFSQGFQYLLDLFRGSAFPLILLLGVLAIIPGIPGSKSSYRGRITLFTAGSFYAFFVIRGGGDFMHGRFLLPSVILFALSSHGLFDKILSGSKKGKYVILIISLLLFSISHLIIPLQKRGSEGFVNNISDERYSFYKDRMVPLKDLFTDDIIFMWKTIGKNYSELSKRSRIRLRIAYNTVGYIGYYSGPAVHVLDRLGLTDRFVARLPLRKRGRPGHEKSAPFPYIFYRGVTFGETPYPLWNKIASTKYGILWDLSRKTLSKFRFFLPPDFKRKLDLKIRNFMEDSTIEKLENEKDFICFLQKYWYPYASGEFREIFRSVKKSIGSESKISEWIKNNRDKIEQSDKIISGKLTLNRFFKNIVHSIKEIF